MITESPYINSLLEKGILIVEGSLDSYQLSFADKKEYFCDLESGTGQMFVNTSAGRIRYFPRDIIDQHREEFNAQTSGHCQIALMTFADPLNKDLSRHTFYAVIADGKTTEYNLGRDIPAWRKKLLKEDWQVNNPTRLSLIAAAEDVQFLATNSPEETNGNLQRSRKAFRHVALCPANTSAAAHICMDSEIDRHVGLRFHIYGRKANNCTAHAGEIFRRYGFEIKDIGLYPDGQPPHSLLLKNKIEALQSAGEEPQLTLIMQSYDKSLSIPIYQRNGVTYIDATQLYDQYLERRHLKLDQKLRYTLDSFLQQLADNGITLCDGSISYNQETLNNGESIHVTLQNAQAVQAPTKPAIALG